MKGNKMDIKFGPSGNSQSFYDAGYKSSLDMPKWLADRGLDAYEYSVTKGIRFKEETARKIGNQARENNIFLSMHAPYYINLANPDAQKREKSKAYIADTLEAAEWMGAQRIVFHPGSRGKLEREEAFKLVLNTFEEVLDVVYKKQYHNIALCPETMGKINQIGTLEEVLQLCKLDKKVIPTIDFGHINARNMGSLQDKEDFEKLMDTIEQYLGKQRTSTIHIHFSRIEYTAGGERRHWTYADTQFGPNFEPLAEILVERDLKPVVICESKGTMAEDAMLFREIYNNIQNKKGKK